MFVTLITSIDRVADGSASAARSLGRWTAEAVDPLPAYDTFRSDDIRSARSDLLHGNMSSHTSAVSQAQNLRNDTRASFEILIEQLFQAPKASAKGQLEQFVSEVLLGFVDADLGLVDKGLGDWVSELLIDENAKRVTEQLARTLADRLHQRLVPPSRPAGGAWLQSLNLRSVADARVSKSLATGTTRFADTVDQIKQLTAAGDDARLATFAKTNRLELGDRVAVAALTHADIADLAEVKRAAQALRVLRQADTLIGPASSRAAAKTADTMIDITKVIFKVVF